MCAAPGSKTTQILEIITNNEKEVTINNNNSNNQLQQQRQGFVVANDSSTDRAYMLVHQCRRLCSPFLMVTTHQGQQFPTTASNTGLILYDRILCDVPCSGDGTLRKNPMIWDKWGLNGSLALHSLQLSIAQRGFQLLAPGGVMVYSTCSMCPYGKLE